MANGNLGDTGMRWRFYSDMVDRDLASIEAKADATIARINAKLGKVAGNGNTGMPGNLNTQSNSAASMATMSNAQSGTALAGIGLGAALLSAHSMAQASGVSAGANISSAQQQLAQVHQQALMQSAQVNSNYSFAEYAANNLSGLQYKSRGFKIGNGGEISVGGVSSGPYGGPYDKGGRTNQGNITGNFSNGGGGGGGGGGGDKNGTPVYITNWGDMPGGGGGGGDGDGGNGGPGKGGNKQLKGLLTASSIIYAAKVASEVGLAFVDRNHGMAMNEINARSDPLKRDLLNAQQGAAGSGVPLGGWVIDAMTRNTFNKRIEHNTREMQRRDFDIQQGADEGAERGAYVQSHAAGISGVGGQLLNNSASGMVQHSSVSAQRQKGRLDVPGDYSTWDNIPGVGKRETRHHPMDEYDAMTRRMLADVDRNTQSSGDLIRNNTELNTKLLGIDTEAKGMANRLRPVAGSAYGTSQSAIETLKNAAMMNEKALGTGVLSQTDFSMAQRNVGASALNTVASLRGQQVDVLKNIYGGRPTEITGLQSVEAMKDISPETNQEAINALTKAISSLEVEIKKLKP